jgi:hypothetical protein
MTMAAVLASSLLVAGCLGHRSSAAVPTVVEHPAKDGLVTPSNLAYLMAQKCGSTRGDVGLDLRQGTLHLRTQFSCALVRENRSGLEQELVDRVAGRNDAGARADLVNTLAHEVGVNAYPRADIVWQIGTGADGCFRVDDVALHRQDISEVGAQPGAFHETPVHWAEVEAVRYAGTCPQKLGAFFATLTQAGQPAAARTVRTELTRLGVTS